ncbi:hypothetical protein AMTRI_Chr07g79750 [Amborella trichopoda]
MPEEEKPNIPIKVAASSRSSNGKNILFFCLFCTRKFFSSQALTRKAQKANDYRLCLLGSSWPLAIAPNLGHGFGSNGAPRFNARFSSPCRDHYLDQRKRIMGL